MSWAPVEDTEHSVCEGHQTRIAVHATHLSLLLSVSETAQKECATVGKRTVFVHLEQIEVMITSISVPAWFLVVLAVD